METKNLLFNLANNLSKKIYKLSLLFPYKYQSSIGDQLRRSCLSVSLNIVEGGARSSPKEKRQFLNITYASLKETKYLLYFSKEFELVRSEEYLSIMNEINELAKILYSLLYKKSNQ